MMVDGCQNYEPAQTSVHSYITLICKNCSIYVSTLSGVFQIIVSKMTTLNNTEPFSYSQCFKLYKYKT